MIERRKGLVESVQAIKDIDSSLTEFIIQIDFDDYVVFYDKAAMLDFVNKEVFYTTRPDIVEGRKVEVICEIALVTEVVTLDKQDTNVKLVPFNVKRPVCNFNIKDIRFGEYKIGCIAILVSMEKGESRKATWIDCKLIDAYGHLFELRMFTTLTSVDDLKQYEAMINGYVEFDMESTRYGYQTSALSSLSQDVEKSPEIAIAKNIVMSYVNSDAELSQLVANTGLEIALDNFVDFEPGYLWVRMASELYFIETLDNVTSGININTLKRAVVVTRLYALPHSGNWSNGLINFAKVLRYKDICKDEDLRGILDVFYQGNNTDTKYLYFQIREIVDNIINIRRDLNDAKKNYSSLIDECHSAFNGLL